MHVPDFENNFFIIRLTKSNIPIGSLVGTSPFFYFSDSQQCEWELLAKIVHKLFLWLYWFKMALIMIIFGLDFLFTKKFKFEREKNLKETSPKLKKKLVLLRIEPGTPSIAVHCSTNWAVWIHYKKQIFYLKSWFVDL